MKLLNYIQNGRPVPALLHNGLVLPLQAAAAAERQVLPGSMEDLICNLDQFEALARQVDAAFKTGSYAELALPLDGLELAAPVTRPASCRDGYAFRQHVATARRNRGVEMIPEFDEYPIFYFTNHNAITGPGAIQVMPDHLRGLDFELEAAIVLGKRGRNIKAKDADDYIFGYTIMNDWSARVLQMEEMKLNLGPAKGKDFATSIGPVLVTRDELQQYLAPPPAGHTGEAFGLNMVARINGKEVSRGKLSDMDWTFAEIVERCAYGVTVYPTDVIGSGTVGTGCLLELNGTAKLNDPAFQPVWLKAGDTVELEIDGLGVLTNTIVKDESEMSILELKKNAG